MFPDFKTDYSNYCLLGGCYWPYGFLSLLGSQNYNLIGSNNQPTQAVSLVDEGADAKKKTKWLGNHSRTSQDFDSWLKLFEGLLPQLILFPFSAKHFIPF